MFRRNNLAKFNVLYKYFSKLKEDNPDLQQVKPEIEESKQILKDIFGEDDVAKLLEEDLINFAWLIKYIRGKQFPGFIEEETKALSDGFKELAKEFFLKKILDGITLEKAIESKEINKLIWLVNKDNVNFTLGNSTDIKYQFVESNKRSIVKIFDSQITPLMVAAEKGNVYQLNDFLLKGANVNSRSRANANALFYALKGGNSKICEIVLSKMNFETINGALRFQVEDLPFKEGDTPLIAAIRMNNVKMVQELIKKNADINHKNKNGKTPLIIAQELSADQEIVKLLLETSNQELTSEEICHEILHMKDLFVLAIESTTNEENLYSTWLNDPNNLDKNIQLTNDEVLVLKSLFLNLNNQDFVSALELAKDKMPRMGYLPPLLIDFFNSNPEFKTFFSEKILKFYSIALKFNAYLKDKNYQFLDNWSLKRDQVARPAEQIPEYPRTHPLFPTIKEAKEDPSQVYSDHLSILFKDVPVFKQEKINIISLNILGPGVEASGAHITDGWENQIEARIRYSKIVDGFLKAIENHNVDVIALQEVTSEYIVPLLKLKLGNKWKIIVDERIGIITCFNQERFQCCETSFQRTEVVRRRSLTLKNRKTDELVEVHNVWGEFNNVPYNHEEELTALITNKKYPSIVVGDTNSRSAPLDNKERNITTGNIPPLFNKKNGHPKNTQVPDYPDCGHLCKGNKIEQLDMHVLDYQSGNIVEGEKDLQKLKTWPEYRMIMCLDYRYKSMKVINDQTIFEYQEKLREGLNNDVHVRIAANSLNQKVIAIGGLIKSRGLTQGIMEDITPKLREKGFDIKVVSNNIGQERLGCEESDAMTPIIFVPIKKCTVFNHFIENYIAIKKLGVHERDEYIDKQLSEYPDLNKFASSLKECKTMKDQRGLILNKIEMLKQTHKEGIPFEKTQKYQRLHELLVTCDKPELRKSREEADILGQSNNKKSKKKSEEIHKSLDALIIIKDEYAELKKFVASLKLSKTMKDQRKLIINKIEELNIAYQGSIPFSHTRKYQLLCELLITCDRPEVRKLRAYAETLAQKNDDKANKKSIALHQVLDDLMDIDDENEFHTKLSDAKTNQRLTAQRGFFSKIKTITLVDEALSQLTLTKKS